MSNNISTVVIYRKYFNQLKKAIEQGLTDAVEGNLILVGIAKDLGIMNPILL